MSAGWAVDDEGVALPTDLDPEATYDVLFDDQHVWSLQPGRDARPGDGGGLRVAWPRVLHPHLVGAADVGLRDHVSGTEIARVAHVFAGDDTRRARVVDKGGHDLIVDKYGRLTKPMAAQAPEVRDQVLDATEEVLRVIAEDAGLPAFICYGTLLGAVRSGRIIGHDNDIDLAYLSAYEHPVDVAREAYRVERVLLAAGFTVRRGSAVRLNVRVKAADGTVRGIDVFTACWIEDVLYIPQDTGFELPRDVLTPLGTVELEGRTMPAPGRPEELLAATYGDGWRVPDPSFSYETPRWLSRRFNGWFGGLVTHRKLWDSFYSQIAPTRVPHTPSPFARWVAEHYPADHPLVDLGCGNARDSLFFAGRHGRTVLGFDFSPGALRRGIRVAGTRKLDASFHVVNLYDTRAVLTWGALLVRRPRPVDLYARFLMHALEEPGRENVLRLASMVCRRGGRLFLEFRTPKDAHTRHEFGAQPRDYVDPDALRAQIEAAGGTVVEEISGRGLAPLREEDPFVCRMVVTWPTGASA